MSKILLINASPRKKNCTDMINFAAPLISRLGHTPEIINLSEKNISFCQACDYCKTHDLCAIKDDCNSINHQMSASDALIFVTPVYFGSMTGQLKTMLDRTLPLRRNSMKLKDKFGAVFAVGGSRNGGQELTINDVMNVMHIHGMIVIGDDNHFGGIVHSPFSQDEIGKQTLRTTIEKICRLLDKASA